MRHPVLLLTIVTSILIAACGTTPTPPPADKIDPIAIWPGDYSPGIINDGSKCWLIDGIEDRTAYKDLEVQWNLEYTNPETGGVEVKGWSEWTTNKNVCPLLPKNGTYLLRVHLRDQAGNVSLEITKVFETLLVPCNKRPFRQPFFKGMDLYINHWELFDSLRNYQGIEFAPEELSDDATFRVTHPDSHIDNILVGGYTAKVWFVKTPISIVAMLVCQNPINGQDIGPFIAEYTQVKTH